MEFRSAGAAAAAVEPNVAWVKALKVSNVCMECYAEIAERFLASKPPISGRAHCGMGQGSGMIFTKNYRL